MHAGDAPSPGHLSRLVFFAFIGVTVLGILGLVCYSIVTGWVPPRSYAGTYTRVVPPAYFAALLATLTLSYVCVVESGAWCVRVHNAHFDNVRPPARVAPAAGRRGTLDDSMRSRRSCGRFRAAP